MQENSIDSFMYVVFENQSQSGGERVDFDANLIDDLVLNRGWLEFTKENNDKSEFHKIIPEKRTGLIREINWNIK